MLERYVKVLSRNCACLICVYTDNTLESFANFHESSGNPIVTETRSDDHTKRKVRQSRRTISILSLVLLLLQYNKSTPNDSRTYRTRYFARVLFIYCIMKYHDRNIIDLWWEKTVIKAFIFQQFYRYIFLKSKKKWKYKSMILAKVSDCKCYEVVAQKFAQIRK